MFGAGDWRLGDAVAPLRPPIVVWGGLCFAFGVLAALAAKLPLPFKRPSGGHGSADEDEETEPAMEGTVYGAIATRSC